MIIAQERDNAFGFTQATTMKASQEIIRQIQTSIISGKLSPGDKLPSERDLIKLFGRSRPIVREALGSLEKAGLIKIIPGSGAVVCEIDEIHVIQPLEMMLKLEQVTSLELFEFRLVTETALAKWAALKRTDNDLDKMAKVLQQEEYYSSNWEEFHNNDMYFHELVASAARNSVAEIFIKVLRKMLVDAVGNAFKNLSEDQRQEERDLLLKYHKGIFTAIKEQNAAKAAYLTEEHLNQFKKLTVNGVKKGVNIS